MDFVDYFENYYRIQLPDGTRTTPHMSEYDKKVLRLAQELNVDPYIRVGGRRCGTRYDVHPLIKDRINSCS